VQFISVQFVSIQTSDYKVNTETDKHHYTIGPAISKHKMHTSKITVKLSCALRHPNKRGNSKKMLTEKY